jgi:hypothetical protein
VIVAASSPLALTCHSSSTDHGPASLLKIVSTAGVEAGTDSSVAAICGYAASLHDPITKVKDFRRESSIGFG